MDWLTRRPTPDDLDHPLVISSLVIFSVVLAVAWYYNHRPGSAPMASGQSQRFVRQASSWIAWPAGIGLFIVINQLLQIDPGTMGRPIWQVIALVALVLVAGVIAWRAPADRRAHREHQAAMASRAVNRRPVRKRH